MADILSIQTPYQDQDTVTSTNLNDLVKKATFTSAVVDGATTQLSSGAIIVRDGGITTNKILNESVTLQKLDTATQGKLLQGLEIEAGVNGESIVGGTKAGNQRGTFALDIQNKETTAPLDYVASGDSAVAYGFTNKVSSNYSTAIGQRNVASGNYSSAIGYSNAVSGVQSMAIGKDCSASGASSIAAGYLNILAGANSAAIGYSNEVESGCTDSAVIGYSNSVTGTSQKSFAIGANNKATGNTAIALGTNNDVTASFSSAVGSNNTVSDTESHAFGRNISISSPYSAEIGIWSSSTNRKTAVKATYNGGVALTCENSASAPSDQSTAGAEDIQQLGRSMFTIQRNGDAFTLYFNDGGTIKSLSLGTVS